MDAKALFPKGFHPVYENMLPSGAGYAPVLPRSTAEIKYYYVDFGISSHIPSDSPDKLVVGNFGRDQDVPELSITVPYDPFKVDVFILGNLFDKVFINVRSATAHRNSLLIDAQVILKSRIFASFGAVDEDRGC